MSISSKYSLFVNFYKKKKTFVPSPLYFSILLDYTNLIFKIFYIVEKIKNQFCDVLIIYFRFGVTFLLTLVGSRMVSLCKPLGVMTIEKRINV